MPASMSAAPVGPVAGDDLEEVLRQAGAVPDLLRLERDERRHLARLEHDGVAGDERGDDVAQRELEREVPRRDDADDAARARSGRSSSGASSGAARARAARGCVGAFLRSRWRGRRPPSPRAGAPRGAACRTRARAGRRSRRRGRRSRRGSGARGARAPRPGARPTPPARGGRGPRPASPRPASCSAPRRAARPSPARSSGSSRPTARSCRCSRRSRTLTTLPISSSLRAPAADAGAAGTLASPAPIGNR